MEGMGVCGSIGGTGFNKVLFRWVTFHFLDLCAHLDALLSLTGDESSDSLDDEDSSNEDSLVEDDDVLVEYSELDELGDESHESSLLRRDDLCFSGHLTSLNAQPR